MVKKFVIFSVLIILALSLFVSARPPWERDDSSNCPITDQTDFAYYGETGRGGVGDLSKGWLNHFLEWWKAQDPSVDYVELNDKQVRGDCDLDSFPNLKLYIQPGGDAYLQQKTLRGDGKSNILSYINSGKAYLGICAGAYYAAGDYFWQGDYYDWGDLLGVYPTLEGSITDIADYDSDPGYAVTSLTSGHDMVYYGGPTRGWRDTSSVFPGDSLNGFAALGGDIPASIRDDNLLLMSVHAEAYENEGIAGLSTEQRKENYIWFANRINEVAGTSFYVPESQLPVCGNGVLEQGEQCDGSDFGGETCTSLGYDYGTLGCSSECTLDVSSCELNSSGYCGDGICSSDEDYLSCSSDCSAPEPEPIELLFDGFENGLASWNVYGVGNPWITSTGSSYEGSYSAMSQQSGAGDPTYMETYVNASWLSSLTLEYYRKLVGLDAADDFSVEYFDRSWNVLEHVSSTTDSNFVFKSFSLPTSTTKVRFMCEAGAVSEYCFVDNFRIFGE